MTPQELKNSILQRAIQGKLVEQRPEEGTGEDLFKQIQEEKQALIKSGNSKKDKPLPEITEDEKPFDIPESWEWVRLGDFCSIYNGDSINADKKQAKYSKKCEGHFYIGTKDVGFDNSVNYDNGVYIPFSEVNFKIAAANSVLMCMEGGSAGRKIAIIDKDVCFGNKLCCFYPVVIPNKYLFFFLQSKAFYAQFTVLMTGIIGGVGVQKLKNIIIPIPPLAEQKRIVAKIEELMPLIDRYEKAWTKLEELNKRFPGDMQKSLLQMAIQGKLVEQRPEEGTGEELFKQIQEEKVQLIKQGKIKKSKPLPEITDDEKPFDIPESWKWVRIGCMFEVGTGMTPLKSETRFYDNGTIPWVTSSLTSNRFVDKADTLITDYALSNTSLVVYPAHTLIIAMYGQGKTRGQVSELLINATINQACAALGNIIKNQSLVSYVYYFFLFNYGILRKKAEGTSQPNLNLQKIKEIAIPLPPLAEQKRIVAKLEELLPLCEKLK